MSRIGVVAALASLCVAATEPSLAQQTQGQNTQGAAQDANAQAAAQPAPAGPRKDRRVGKLHDRLRAQKAQEDKDREEASHPYADYLDFKKSLEKAVGLTYQIQPTVMFQWGNPNGGTAAIQGILGPSLNWDMFDNPDIGQGSIQFGYTLNKYWSRQTGVSMSNRLTILSQINNSAANTYIFSQLTYTHVFPGNLLQVTVGQHGFSLFDSNQYASNQQMNFINYALSQNGSQAYVPDSLGGYVQINPTSTVSLAAGLQDANNITGHYIQTKTFGEGPWAWFLYGQCTPTLPFLPSSQFSQYSLVYYRQPSVSEQPESGQGWFLNAVQNLNANWGLFARANHSVGPISTIATSLAGGVVYNNPFGSGAKDQIGLGLAWNATNKSAFVGEAVRSSETLAEVYWNHVFFKVFQIGPDVQVIFNPALYPRAGTSEVFSLRLTGLI